jgi:TRAP-type mannitol/chloroaromatic compound transport system substrate-binding protein
MPVGYTAGTTLWDFMAVNFENHIKVLSGGRVVIQSFAGGTIVPGFKVTESVRNRVAEASNTWAPYEIGRDPSTALFGGGPGGLNSEKMFQWYYEGKREELLAQWWMETSGVVSFLPWFGSN